MEHLQVVGATILISILLFAFICFYLYIFYAIHVKVAEAIEKTGELEEIKTENVEEHIENIAVAISSFTSMSKMENEKSVISKCIRTTENATHRQIEDASCLNANEGWKSPKHLHGTNGQELFAFEYIGGT